MPKRPTGDGEGLQAGRTADGRQIVATVPQESRAGFRTRFRRPHAAALWAISGFRRGPLRVFLYDAAYRTGCLISDT